MSDVAIHLYGLLALVVFLAAAAALSLGGLISLIVAFFRGLGSGDGVSKQGAFAFVLAAIPLIVLDLIAFGILAYFIDRNSDETNEFLDTAAIYAWLPLQLIVWVVVGVIINNRRKAAKRE